MIVRCGECGEEYQLGSNQKLSDYQCKCGGKLFSNKVGTENIPKNPKVKNNVITFSRKWVLVAGLFFILMGIENAITLIIGVLTLMIGLILFFTDSWGVYLVIFLLWLFGGILAFLFVPMSNVTSWFGGILVAFFGLSGLIDVATSRRNKVKGHLN
jgi:DNA-directed RNA polymerase subunit RPC12/RpoP